jgi:D-alanyl-D-alanine carboxypeptidase
MPFALRRLSAGLIALVVVLVTAGCFQATRSADTAGTPDARLQQLLDRWRHRADVPAVTVAVTGSGRTRLVAASGTGQRGGDDRVTTESQFRIASITKMFVATVVLQLVEEGRLRLDAPVADYVPGFALARGVTIRQLLNHTSGIPDYGRTKRFNEGLLADRDRRWSSDEILALVAGFRRDFRPGTNYLYSNTGYILLGKVIDAVTGSTWAGEIRRRILDPLHLQHTYIPGFENVQGRVVPGYIDVNQDGHEENTETGRPWPSLETSEDSAGAIVSTAGDLATFGTALFHGKLVRPATLRQMVAEGPHHPRIANYGLGVQTYRPDYQLTLRGHGGMTLGFKSVLWYVPNHDVLVVVLTNDVRADPSDLAELMIRTAARQHH